MLDETRSRRLIDIIVEHTLIEAGQLRDDTSLFHDFGVGGMDGEELLDAIGEEFGIDMTEVPWWDYFGEERPYNPFYHLYCFLKGKRLDHDIVRLQISDLKTTIDKGSWQPPALTRSCEADGRKA
jgi:acyl carrier protein